MLYILDIGFKWGVCNSVGSNGDGVIASAFGASCPLLIISCILIGFKRGACNSVGVNKRYYMYYALYLETRD